MTKKDIIDGFNIENHIVYNAKTALLYDQTMLIMLHTLRGGGSQRAIESLIPLIQSHKYNIVIISPEDGIYRDIFLSFPGVTIVIQPEYEISDTYQTFLNDNFDFVIINSCAGGYCKYFQNASTPVFWWIHESMTVFSENAENSFFHPSLLSDNFHFITSWKQFAYDFKAMYHKDIDILPIAIDDVNMARTASLSENVTSSVQKSKFNFLIPGTYNTLKGFQNVVLAVASLPTYIKDICSFTFVGYIDEVPLYEKLLDISGKLPCIKIMDSVNQMALYDIYKSSDCIIIPTLLDAGPLTAVEAFMHQKCCIISNAAGIACYTNNNEHALIYDMDDTETLSKYIMNIVANPDIITSIGSNARHLYQTHFTNEIMSNYLAIILKKKGLI